MSAFMLRLRAITRTEDGWRLVSMEGETFDVAPGSEADSKITVTQSFGADSYLHWVRLEVSIAGQVVDVHDVTPIR